jgi:NAD(P)-dependent dehydrogenase (short-subunit alcohol dehydrogenase family)
MGDRMAGKVAVITGAASGLGEASARRFVEEGCRVVIADIQDAPGAAVAASLGSSAVFAHCDVTVEADVAAAIDLAVSTWGKLDVMFSNAGIVGSVGPIAETPTDAWLRTIDVLLNSVFYGAKRCRTTRRPWPARLHGSQGSHCRFRQIALRRTNRSRNSRQRNSPWKLSHCAHGSGAVG